MPRGKRGYYRGHSRGGASRGGRGGGALRTTFIPFAGAPRVQNDHSLADEARNAGRPHSNWNSDQRLRFSRVTFVSAGILETKLQVPDRIQNGNETAFASLNLDSPIEDVSEVDVHVEVEEVKIEVEAEAAEESDHLDDRPLAPESSATTPPFFMIDTKGDNTVYNNYPRPKVRSPSPATSNSTFMIDTNGDSSISKTQLPRPIVRSPSPTPSNSSEEVLLFAGRKNMERVAVKPPSRNIETITDPFDEKIKMVEEKILEKEELLERNLHPNALSRTPPPNQEHPNQNSKGFTSNLPSRPKAKAPARRHRHRKHSNVQQEEEDAVIADYVANMDSDDREAILQSPSWNSRHLGADNDFWQEETDVSSREALAANDDPKRGWGSNELEDFDDLSTSDGVMGEVQEILSKRERESGVQYLVIWESQTADEARWVPITTLASLTALDLIAIFEEEEKLVARFEAASDDDDDDDDSLDLEEIDDAADEDDLRQRLMDRMTDEQIARLLAKQEELGMGSQELLLFDDDVDADEEDGFGTSKAAAKYVSFSSFKKTRSKRPRGEFLPTTALADAYDGFDVMDFERPSLKKKPKGRNGKLILDDFSDSEFEESMRTAWDNDRIKKKERKQEREALRAQGLLGMKNGKPDLKQKYKEGMSMSTIKEEVKKFLMSSNTTLALPPMTKDDRKIVHEIANAFKLKSKSVGDGKNRAPVLTRTQRTLGYFDGAFVKLGGKFKRRTDVGRNKSSFGQARGGGNVSGASYRDGDVVGASAPELGVENKGHALLLKMGWSQGTALGALNNKGIMLPISHVVKTTKSGLG